jgi:hypothetical protein
MRGPVRSTRSLLRHRRRPAYADVRSATVLGEKEERQLVENAPGEGLG